MTTRIKVMVFLDGSNIFWSLRRHNLKIDFYKLVSTLVGDRFLVRPYYYSSVSVPPNQRQIAFYQALKYQGFHVVTKPLVFRQTKNQEILTEKGVDLSLATDFLVSAFRNLYDTAILVSGDDDYAPVIDEVKRLGKTVEVAAFSSDAGSQIRNAADKFIPLENLKDEILLETSKE